MHKNHLEIYLATLLRKWGDWVRVKDMLEEGIVGSEAQIHNLIKKGKSPPSVKIGGRLLFKKEDVVDWIRRGYNKGDLK